MKHKHADVLIAIAEGKEVQYREQWSDWRNADLDVLEGTKDPFTFPDLEWRIKPEPKPDIAYYVIAEIEENHLKSINIAENNCFSFLSKNKTFSDNLKLTFDGETGKLKKAEVL